jgi:hypothetical protein
MDIELHRHISKAAITAAVVCCLVSCASSPEVEQRAQEIEEDIETILSEPLDAAEYGEPRRCLAAHEYRDFRVLDDQRIVFKGSGGKLWLNTLRARCPDLRHATGLRIKSTSSMGRICDLDSFQAGDWFDWPWYRRSPLRWGSTWGTGMRCSLGVFQPVNEAQVAAIRGALKSR